jgi:hypothetical protein
MEVINVEWDDFLRGYVVKDNKPIKLNLGGHYYWKYPIFSLNAKHIFVEVLNVYDVQGKQWVKADEYKGCITTH